MVEVLGLDLGAELGRMSHQVAARDLAQLAKAEPAKACIGEHQAQLAPADGQHLAEREAPQATVVFEPQRGQGRRPDVHVTIHRHGEMHAEEGLVEIRYRVDVGAQLPGARVAVQVEPLNGRMR